MNIIYTQEGCPKCNILKKKMNSKNIEYTECNDINVLMSKGIDFTPVLEVDGKMMEYADAIKWVNKE